MDKLEIANTIKTQIGNKALHLIGAKNLVGSQNSLSFKVMRNSKKVTHIKIKLNSMDLYDMTFFNCRAGNIKTISEQNGVYCDQLRQMIETNTELYTSL